MKREKTYTTDVKYAKIRQFLIMLFIISSYTGANAQSDSIGIRSASSMQALIDMGKEYAAINDIDNAIYSFSVVMQRYEQSPNANNDKYYLEAMMQTASFYLSIGWYDAAKPYVERSYGMAQKIFTKSSREYMLATILIGDYSYYTGNVRRAFEYYDNALKHKMLNPTNNAKVLRRLGDIYSMPPIKKEYMTKAVDYYYQALKVYDGVNYHENYQKVKGRYNYPYPNGKTYAENLKEIGLALMLEQKYEDASGYYEEAKNIYLYNNQLLDAAKNTSAQGFIYQLAGDTLKSNTYYLTSFDMIAQYASTAYDDMGPIRRKSFVNTTSHEFNWAYPTMVYNQYMARPDLIGLEYNRTLFLKDTEFRPQSGKCKTIKDRNGLMPVTNWKDVLSKLGDNEAVVEFTRFNYFNGKELSDSIIYCAIIMHPGDKLPTYIPLFEERELAALTKGRQKDVLMSNGNLLYDMIWGKIAPLMRRGETIYFSPCGMLHNINIEALPVTSNRILGETYNMIRITSTSRLVAPHPIPSDTAALFFGGIDFYPAIDTMAHEAYYYDGFRLKERKYMDEKLLQEVDSLNGSLENVEEIGAIFFGHSCPTYIYTKAEANEEAFKTAGPKRPRVLHLDTYGFCHPMAIKSIQSIYSHPILDTRDAQEHSCIYFAGASNYLGAYHDSIPEGVFDGIVTASEIAEMDLRGTELLVISAFNAGETNLTYEAMEGLIQAFKQAGVQTILYTAWKPDNEIRKAFMSEFYKQWMGGKSKIEAFNLARRKIRKISDFIENWASFMMVDGDK